MNRYVMQITYIPTMDEDRFFVWVTEENGNFGVESSQILLQALRQLNVFKTSFTNKQVIFEDEQGRQTERSGYMIPMEDLFLLLKEPWQMDEIVPGNTMKFIAKIAANLSVLLESGHYYPSVLSVEKESKIFAFSHWLVSRQCFETSDLFNQWIREIPFEALSALELASFGIRKWLNILLDTWTDRIVRSFLSPSFPWRRSEFAVTDMRKKWFNDLKQPKNLCFFTTEDSNVIKEINQLKEDCDNWHQAIAGDTRPDPKRVLEQFKYMKIGLDLEPVSLIFCMEPDNGDNPFHSDETWTVMLKIGVQSHNQEQLLEGEEACSRHLTVRQWLHKKFDRLAKIHPIFRQFGYQMYDNDFRFQCSTNDFMAFYSEVEKFGVQIQFPEWMKMRSDSKQSPSIRLQPEFQQRVSSFSLDTLVDFNWQVSLGDVSLSVERFKSLIEQQQRFIKHQNEWVKLPFEKMRAAYKELAQAEKFIGRKTNMSDLLRMSILENQDENRFIEIDHRPAAKNYLKTLLQPVKKSKRPPALFKGVLRPYQKHGYAWLDEQRNKGVGVCLADDMGLGKTIQTIAYLVSAIKKSRKTPVLIVCPTSLIENWKRELERFAPTLAVYSHHGSDRLKEDTFETQKSLFDIMITSYNLATRDASFLVHQKWPIMVIDEAQAIKNPSTKQSRMIRQFNADHRVALTGTPMENHLEELWAIMDFLNPGYLGSLAGFRRNFVRPVEKKNDQEKIDLIRRFVQPFMLRREKSDRTIIRDLPDKIEKKMYCPLSTEQATLYQNVVSDLMNQMKHANGIERKGLILASLTKLKQLCDHPQLILKTTPKIEQSGKLVQFIQLLDSLLNESRSSLVFTQYVRMGHMLKDFIREKFVNCPVHFMHGGLSSLKREELITKFRKQKEPSVFILSLKTGGVGLNLTEASDVIHYDRWWNPAVENQATDRAHRIGQEQNVHVHKMISIGTLEEKIDEMIERKRSLTEKVIGQGDGWVTEMKDDEVYDLIRLREKVMAN